MYQDFLVIGWRFKAKITLLASLNQRLEPMAVGALLEIENEKVVGGVLVDADLPEKLLDA